MTNKALYFMAICTALNAVAMEKDDDNNPSTVKTGFVGQRRENQNINSNEIKSLINKLKNADLKSYERVFASFEIRLDDFLEFCNEHELDPYAILRDFKSKPGLLTICMLIRENNPDLLIAYYKVLKDESYDSELFLQPGFLFDFCSLIAVSHKNLRIFFREFLRSKAIVCFQNLGICLKLHQKSLASCVNRIFTIERLSDFCNKRGTWNDISLNQIHFLGMLLLVGQTNRYVGKIVKSIIRPQTDATFNILNYIVRGCLNPNLLSVLVCIGIDIDKTNEINASTSLNMAAFMGKINVILELLRNGANVNYKNLHGHTPLISALNPNISLDDIHIIVRLIIAFEGNINLKDKEGLTALFHAIRIRDLGTIVLLLQNKAQTDVIDNQGNTILQFASNCFRIRRNETSQQIAQLLITHVRSLWST